MRFSDRTRHIHTTVDLYPHLFEGILGQTNLGPGDPRLPTPDHVLQAVTDSIDKGNTGYTSTSGLASLRDAAREYFFEHHRIEYARPEVIVGVGSKQLIANTLLATLNPGDEVILIAPFYPVYRQMILLAGGTSVPVPSLSNEGYRLPLERIRSALTERTRWIIINSPNNPTGVVYSGEELTGLVEMLEGFPDTGIIDDQVYELLTFDGVCAPSSAAVGAEGRRRTLAVSGVSKAYAMTGFRVGFAAGDAELIEMLGRLSYVTTSATATPSQYAAIAALTGPQDAVAVGQERGRRFAEESRRILQQESRLHLVPPQAGMYVFLECSRLLGTTTPEGCAIESDIDLVGYLATAATTQLMPGTLFGSPDHLRVTFATGEEEFAAALERVVTVLGELR